MRTVGPPLGIWLPLQSTAIWGGLSLLTFTVDWRPVAALAIITLFTLPMLAVTFIITERTQAAVVVLATIPAILFARAWGPYPHLEVVAFPVVLYYLVKVMGYLIAMWTTWASVYLMMHRLPHGWRTPMWGRSLASQEEIDKCYSALHTLIVRNRRDRLMV